MIEYSCWEMLEKNAAAVSLEWLDNYNNRHSFNCRNASSGMEQFLCSLLYMPDCLLLLLVRNLLCKLHAQITFASKKEHVLQLQVLLTCLEGPRDELFPPEIYQWVNWAVWADGTPGRVITTQPIKSNLKEGVWIMWKKQYPIKRKALEGIQPVLQKF